MLSVGQTKEMMWPKKYEAAGAPQELLELVARLMPLLLEGQHPAVAVLREQYKLSRVGAVELTGVGFFVSFEVSIDAPLCDPLRFAGGHVKIEAAGVQHGAGCVLFVRDGRLATLEGYTYADEWPEHPKVLALTDAVPIRP
jgi:hypothetical protein